MKRSNGIDVSSVAWRKSSYSNDEGGECVEVAANLPGTVPVRDSKNPTGPVLLFGDRAWAQFVGALNA